MPKVKKSRGRRLEKKEKDQKLENTDENTAKEFFENDGEVLKVFNEAEDYDNGSSKKSKSKPDESDDDSTSSEDEKDGNKKVEQQGERPAFFGIVDRQELEYFKQAESTLSVDGFANAEERDGFIAGVLDEAKGKELKLVTNQICSKLIERLILLGTDDQLKQIFAAFQTRFLQLSKHKYSSHCVETLLVRCAALVEKEMINQPENSMESGMLNMVQELKAELMLLPQDPYGSHVLRIVLLILSGSPLPSPTQTSKIRSKKSKIARKMISIKDNDDYQKSYQTPQSFRNQLQTDILDKYVEDLDTTQSREWAIHKVSSPFVQLLIQAESIVSSEKKKKKGLLPFTNKIFNSDDKEQAFVEYLLSDPIGSHFLESAIQWVPLKTCERLYQSYIQSRISKLAHREAGHFVIQSFLKRLRVVEVKEILDELVPEIGIFMEQGNAVLVRAVIDAASEHDYKSQDITETMMRHYGVQQEDRSKSQFLEKMLNLEGSTLGNTRGDWPTAEEMHRSLMLQSLIKVSNQILEHTLDAFIEMDQGRIMEISKHSVFSHVLETCLELPPPSVNIIHRRKLINHLNGMFVDLACNAYGSHLVDKCWKFTFKLKHLRERIAQEMAGEEEKVKNSIYGRRVWKNWNMDKFIRRKHDWWNVVKQQEDEIVANNKELVKPPPSAATVAASRRNNDGKNYHRRGGDNDGGIGSSGRSNNRFKPYKRPS